MVCLGCVKEYPAIDRGGAAVGGGRQVKGSAKRQALIHFNAVLLIYLGEPSSSIPSLPW
jgi:hypothetical protein